MILNEFEVNEGLLNGGLETAAATLLSFEKEITLKLTAASATLLSFEKTIASTASGTLCSFEKQIVNSATTNTFYSRNGWEPIITLGGLTVRANKLHGLIRVTKVEDDNHLAQFTIILDPDVYDLYNFQGKSVTINVRKNNVVTRVFTGIVDIPVINVIEEKLTLNCIADRRRLLGNLTSIEPFLGTYSEIILGQANDTYERITARLSTTAASLDFDGANNATVTSWTPKTVPDFSFGSNAVYRRDPQLRLESSGKLVNTVNLTLEYGYQRCHHRQIAYVWNHPYRPTDTVNGLGGICPFLQDRPSMPTRDLIRSAVEGVGWPVRNDISFGAQFKTGVYQCSGSWVAWSTVETGYYNAPIVDSNGNVVNDASGNPLTRSVQTIVSDNTNLYTMNAAWNATTRFNQNITEAYTITVAAPRSVSTYGTLPTSEKYGYTATNPYNEWEQYEAYKNPPTGVTLSPASPTSSYFFNGDQDRSTFNLAFVCALQKAKTAILRSHRDTRIIFQRDLTPTMELRHTVALTGKWVRGKGKCYSITHNMCIADCEAGTAGEAYTEVELAQYRGELTTSETTLSPTAPPVDEPNVQQPAIALQTHLGVDPESAGSENWTGYVGNIAVEQQIRTQTGFITNFTRTNYQESFIVNTPPIQPEFRDDRVLTKTASYNINIPTDSTEYEAYG